MVKSPTKKLVKVRVKDTSVFKPAQINEIKNVLASVGLAYGSLGEFGGTPGNGIQDCGEHSCVGFQPGGGDCAEQGSRCTAEACDTQACSGHACDSNSCDTEACAGHICDIHEKEAGNVMASMTSKSQSFAALQNALKKLDGSPKNQISLSLN